MLGVASSDGILMAGSLKGASKNLLHVVLPLATVFRGVLKREFYAACVKRAEKMQENAVKSPLC